MSPPAPQIVAFGGGGFSMEAGNPLLDDYVLGLTGKERPRVCFLPSASGDADHYIVRFYRAFESSRCEPSHISLFRREPNAPDLRTHLLGQDVIYVGGGSVISLLGVWRAHGIDVILREAWNAGVVLCGVSAGSLCWFREAVSAFHGKPTRVGGLGFLPWSNTVHYDGERDRDRAYREFLADGLCAGYASEDGAALHFVGDQLVRVVSSRPKARAYRMRTVRGRVVRTALRTTYLGDAGAPIADVIPGSTLESGPAQVSPPAASLAAAAGS
jgi:dipeptidase E